MLIAGAGIIVTGSAGGVAHAISSRRAQKQRQSDGSSTRVTAHRTSSTLVVVQVALSVVLLVGAGLLVKGFMRVAPSEPGFAIQNRATIVAYLSERTADTANGRARRLRMMDDVSERMRRVPGVGDVAVTSFLPLTGMTWSAGAEPLGAALGQGQLNVNQHTISPNYFDVMQMPLRHGRGFTHADKDGAEFVGVINEKAAASWWPGDDAVGKQVAIGKGPNRQVLSIVGVVRDARLIGWDTKIRLEIYRPIAQSDADLMSFVVATTVDPRTVIPALRQAFWSVAPRVPIESSSDLATLAFEPLSRAKFFSVVMSLFAIAAVVLSALGVYGLLSFAVVQRTREIGIRMALGATSERIGRLVIGRALVIGVIGVVTGVLGARGLSRYIGSLLLEVTATDVGVFAIAALVVFAVAVLAACVPTYQALRVDPIKSLRA